MISETTNPRFHGAGVADYDARMGTSRNPFFAAIRREVTHKCQVRGF